MENENISTNFYSNETDEVQSAVKSGNFLTVYKKKSTFKGATENDFWYSATNSKGNSIICKFKSPLPENLASAFIIFDVKGNAKSKEVEVKGETYINYTYYITECKFADIPAEDLPF